MSNRCLVVLVLLLNNCQFIHAQQSVNGKIYSATTDSVLSAVTVYNKTQKLSSYSGKDGSYRIIAAEGDTLIFSAIGFTPAVLTVQFHMLLTRYDITMQMKIATLETVKLTSSYREDSLNRRYYYQSVYKKQPGITGFNTPDGAGVSLSPISYLSRESKQLRSLKKRLLKEEEDDYIDHSFPAEWVGKLTGLKNDSLFLFMYRYRPSYIFCRKTDRQQMLIYINDKLKEFRKPKKNS
jgi:CarboxypepD_reg-like domain